MPHPPLLVDKQKYLTILEAEGLSAALTALHRDTDGLELESFEGREGYQPQMFKDLNDVRVFSRSLWDLALKPAYLPENDGKGKHLSTSS